MKLSLNLSFTPLLPNRYSANPDLIYWTKAILKNFSQLCEIKIDFKDILTISCVLERLKPFTISPLTISSTQI